MVKYSNRAKTCQQLEKDGAILKQNKPVTSLKMMVQYSNKAKTCNRSEKDGDTEPKPVTSQKKDGIYSNKTTCHQSEKDGTILKQGQNLSAVRKSQNKTRAEPKPDYSQKKMVQYSNRVKNCHQ